MKLSRLLSARLKMPQTTSQLKYMQDIRVERRRRLATEVPATVYFHVIGSGGRGGPKSLFLFSDHNRYLFNCGESTQRICTEYTGSKTLAQLTNIFITKRSWENIGGLPGMFLSVRAAGSPDITIHGPDGCMKMHEVTKHFVILHGFDLRSHRAEDGEFEDNVLTVLHVPLTPDSSQPPSNPPKFFDWTKELELDHAVHTTPVVDQTVNAYLVTFKPKPGKLDLKKCLELGIKPGPLFGLLKRGESVTLDDGTVVHSSQVTGEPEASSSYVIIDCPSAEYLSSLLQEPRLKPDNPDLANIQGIFHFSPLSVTSDARYIDWVNSFPDRVSNVFLNDGSSGYSVGRAAYHAAKLNMIAPEVYPRIVMDEEDLQPHTNYDKILSKSCLQASTDLKVWVRPDQGKIELPPIVNPLDSLKSDVEKIDGICEVLKTVRADCDGVLERDRANSPSFPCVTFLGTGSSVPSQCRNVSSILVQTKEDNYFMMDCGEGTFLQLHRQFGREKTLHVLKHLKAIYVSHLHADHHLGLINLVRQRETLLAELNEEPAKLYVLGPSRIANYLVTYHEHFEPILTHLFQIRNEHLLSDHHQLVSPDVKEELLRHTGMRSIKTCRAFHCPGAFCLALVTDGGYKIVYSGDTRPIDAIVKLGTEDQPTDLLIHEATMEHHMIEDCTEKKHTTFTEAVQISKRMGARNTILTHFSQRYSKLPVLDELEVPEADNVGIAFDHTQVTPQTVNVLRRTYPALKQMFEEEMLEMETRRENFRFKRTDNAVNAQLGNDDFEAPALKKHKLLIDKLNNK